MASNPVRALALLATFALTACGDATDLVMSELSEAEAAELGSALMFATFDGTGDVPPPSSAQRAPYEYTENVNGTVACPLGGGVAYDATVSVSGDTESEAGSITYSMTQAHDGCAVQSEQGTVFVLDGAPDITLQFTVVNNGEGVVEWGGSLEGAIRWVTENRTGTCEANFEFSGRQEGETSVSAGLSGTICGHSIVREFSIG